MKVSGFTFIRNAVKFDYPVVEAITSVLPLCDEFVVAVGNSEDNTRDLILSIGSDKIKIIDTIWDDSLREGGRVLADETNKAFQSVAADSDWAFYVQGDEVIHEQFLDNIRQAMVEWKDNSAVEGLLLNYIHFYGSYDYIGDSRRWYRREVRVIKNDKSIYSYRDAQGFRKAGRPLKVKPVNATMHHYGWVKPPQLQQAKQEYFNKLWHSDEWVENMVPKAEVFDYSAIDSLALFNGTHPQVIQNRIARQNWKFSFDPTKKRLPFKSRLLHAIEKLSGWRIGEYRNYKIV